MAPSCPLFLALALFALGQPAAASQSATPACPSSSLAAAACKVLGRRWCCHDPNHDHDYDHDHDEGAFHRVKRSFVPYRTGKKVAAQVSNALDFLLYRGYDKRIRPQLGGPPIPVEVNLSIRSMGPVDENRMAFSLDCYFRQSWVDKRLRYNATGITELALDWRFVTKIWVPDTFFINGKKSYLHKITVPNRFVRVTPDGTVSYSQRLTIWAECHMDLFKFPLDTQMCPLHIGSFGYDAKEILYTWARPKAVSIDKLGLAQFHLKEYKSVEGIVETNRRTKSSASRNDSIASLEFIFERQTGFFLLQIYTPLTLIVVCSWVAFWLIKTEKGGEVPARTALGATSVLSVVNIGFGGKSRPQVGYATAMDVFIVLCFISVFAALVEFACINFIDTFVKRKKKQEEEIEAKKQERLEKKEATTVPLFVMAVVPIVDATANVDVDAIQTERVKEEVAKDDDDDQFEDEEDEDEEVGGLVARMCDQCMKLTYEKFESSIEAMWGPITDMQIYTNTTDVILAIDDKARLYFPLVFFLLQTAYWTFYLYLM